MKKDKEGYRLNLKEEFLLKNYARLGIKACSDILKISPATVDSCVSRMRKRGVPVPKIVESVDPAKKEFIVKNYAKIGAKGCARELEVDMLKVIQWAYRLRRRGKIIAKRVKRLGHKKRLALIDELKQKYGLVPIEFFTRNYSLSAGAIKKIAGEMGLRYFDYRGKYGIYQFCKLLKLEAPRVFKWIKQGLRVEKIFKKKEVNLIDLTEFENFLEARPDVLTELLTSDKIDPETKLILKLDGFTLPKFKEKLVKCECGNEFWTKMTSGRLKCKICRKSVSKFGIKFR